MRFDTNIVRDGFTRPWDEEGVEVMESEEDKSEAGKEHRDFPSAETKPAPELGAAPGCQPAEDRPYRWTITPHPYAPRDFDFYVTDDDTQAQRAWGFLFESADGDEVNATLRFNGLVAAASTQHTASPKASNS